MTIIMYDFRLHIISLFINDVQKHTSQFPDKQQNSPTFQSNENSRHSSQTRIPRHSSQTRTPWHSQSNENSRHSSQTRIPRHSSQTRTPWHSSQKRTPRHSSQTRTPSLSFHYFPESGNPVFTRFTGYSNILVCLFYIRSSFCGPMHTLAHYFKSHFPRKHRLAGCPLDSQSLASSRDRPTLL